MKYCLTCKGLTGEVEIIEAGIEESSDVCPLCGSDEFWYVNDKEELKERLAEREEERKEKLKEKDKFTKPWEKGIDYKELVSGDIIDIHLMRDDSVVIEGTEFKEVVRNLEEEICVVFYFPECNRRREGFYIVGLGYAVKKEGKK